ncbi:MAG TPA: YdbL family protein [Rhodanobacteraceae bacterium]|nr:YdbL family protein [Rhodanobacteraceae bacterium]
MRIRASFVFTAMFAVLATGCVTINVYFPAAAAQKAAQQIVKDVIGPAPSMAAPAPAASAAPATSGGGMTAVLDLLIPAAQAAQPNMNISTPEIQSIRASMRSEFESQVEPLLTSGAVGFTGNGNIGVRDLAAVPLAQRPQVNQIVASANDQRAQLYAAIANANGHPEWEPRIRAVFAQTWIQEARPGWYYQDSSGAWKKK